MHFKGQLAAHFILFFVHEPYYVQTESRQKVYVYVCATK